MPAGPPLHPRVFALLVLTVGVVGLGYNEWRVQAAHRILLIALFCGPTVALLGLLGLADPRVVRALGPRRREYPWPVRVLGLAALALGLAASGWLAFVRYRLVP